MSDTDRWHWPSSTRQPFPCPMSCTGSTGRILLLPTLSDQDESSGPPRHSASTPWPHTHLLYSDKSPDIMVIKRLTGRGKDRLFLFPSRALFVSFCSPISSPCPHRSPQLLVTIHWCRSPDCHLRSQQSLTEGEEKRDRGGRGRQRDVWRECTGETLISLELEKSLRKVTSWRRTERRRLTPRRKPGPEGLLIQRPHPCASVR